MRSNQPFSKNSPDHNETRRNNTYIWVYFLIQSEAARVLEIFTYYKSAQNMKQN